jgi:hypothetical protein
MLLLNSQAERIGTERMTSMRKLKTVGVARTIHRGLLHEAGYPVNVVVTSDCWDTLIKHKNVNRESTRVWDLLFSTRLHLGGGMGGGPVGARRAATNTPSLPSNATSSWHLWDVRGEPTLRRWCVSICPST